MKSLPFYSFILFSILFFHALCVADYSSENDPQRAFAQPEIYEFVRRWKPPPYRNVSENWCYCTNGPEGGCDETKRCIKRDGAACYRSAQLVYNNKTRRMEEWHTFSCATLEPGSGASHLTCNSHRAAHRHPKTIKCCYEGNYCNRYLELPPYAGIKEPIETSKNAMFYNLEELPTLKTTLVVTCIVLFVVFAICYGCFLAAKKRKEKKALKSVVEEDEDIEKQCMLDDEDMFSGSGNGNMTLTQRTVALDLQLIESVGCGRYGDVRKALYRGSYVAVKTFSTIEEASWRNERDVYQTNMLNHENILQYVASDIMSEDSVTKMLLITDYHELGSLYDYLKLKSEDLSIEEALDLSYSAIKGMDHLHRAVFGTGNLRKPEIAHRDIKSKNIIVKRKGVCCIADLGLAVRYDIDAGFIPANPKIQVGTKRYMAPEILAKTMGSTDISSFKMADMYAYALVVWEIAHKVGLDQRDHISSDEHSDSSGIGTESQSDETKNDFGGVGEVRQDSGRQKTDSGYSTDSQTLRKKKSQERMVLYNIAEEKIADAKLLKVADQVEICRNLPTNSKDSGFSGTRSSSYSLPYEGLVTNDPGLDDMKRVVCDEQKRPPIEAWWSIQSESLKILVEMMKECWNGSPPRRHTALKVKKELQKAVELHRERLKAKRPIPVSHTKTISSI